MCLFRRTGVDHQYYSPYPISHHKPHLHLNLHHQPNQCHFLLMPIIIKYYAAFGQKLSTPKANRAAIRRFHSTRSIRRRLPAIAIIRPAHSTDIGQVTDLVWPRIDATAQGNPWHMLFARRSTTRYVHRDSSRNTIRRIVVWSTTAQSAECFGK